MMKILFPTDFSGHAEEAFGYAITLAKKMSAELHILTTFSIQKHSASLMSLEEKIRQNVTEDLDEFINKFKDDIIGIEIKTVIAHAHPGKYIIGYSEKNDMGLIIMGTKGLSDLANIFLGSVTREVMGKGKVPVLAIPFSEGKHLIDDKIVIAHDGLTIKHPERLKILESLCRALSTRITIFHVAESGEKKEKPTLEGFNVDLIKETVIKKGDEPLKEIRLYIEEENIDLLAMIRREKNFWEKLFLTGHTDEEIMRTNVPLLVISDR
ncbi:MAG TPA: universal stress protein [Saprospiraceae bacterium]|nr:universal stress protein [Saprospiraceae bacterium]